MSPDIKSGDIAQLGERLNGIQEVRGSNPLISTKKEHYNGKGFETLAVFVFIEHG